MITSLFCFHMQSHAAESAPLPDGGNLTILQEWERAGLLPPNMVCQTVGNKLPYLAVIKGLNSSVPTLRECTKLRLLKQAAVICKVMTL